MGSLQIKQAAPPELCYDITHFYKWFAPLEKEIDVLVYKLYEHSYDKVKIIEPQFSLTKEKY